VVVCIVALLLVIGVTMTRQEEFQAELKELLKKYDAEIMLEQTGSWDMSYEIAFSGNSEWGKEGLVHDGFEFRGCYFDGGE
jgi:hypothetical protein